LYKSLKDIKLNSLRHVSDLLWSIIR